MDVKCNMQLLEEEKKRLKSFCQAELAEYNRFKEWLDSVKWKEDYYQKFCDAVNEYQNVLMSLTEELEEKVKSMDDFKESLAKYLSAAASFKI